MTINKTREFLSGNNENIITHLASALEKGELMIVLGAGASAGVGLPSWVRLVNKCSSKANIIIGKSQYSLFPEKKTDPSPPPTELLKRMHAIKTIFNTELEYSSMVKECLYSDLSNDDGYYELLKNDLLIALGSLMMGSFRGNVSEVITYNFDDVLEWYLRLHGFITHVVVNPMSLSKKSDVRIYHPHGFLPYKECFKGSENIIFDKISYAKRIGADEGKGWRKNLELLFSTKVTLFIGFSGDDPTFDPLFSLVNESQADRDPIAFWIRTGMRSSEDDGLDEEMKIMSIKLSSYDEIPKFLLSISQTAANSYSDNYCS